MPPSLKKMRGHIAVLLSILPSVCYTFYSFSKVGTMVFKFALLITHEKVDELFLFFSCLSYLRVSQAKSWLLCKAKHFEMLAR